MGRLYLTSRAVVSVGGAASGIVSQQVATQLLPPGTYLTYRRTPEVPWEGSAAKSATGAAGAGAQFAAEEMHQTASAAARPRRETVKAGATVAVSQRGGAQNAM